MDSTVIMSSCLLIAFISIPFATAVSIPPLPTEGVQLYLSSDNSLLPDYSLLKETQLNSSQGIWCQTNTNSSSLNVTWYLPNGTIVPTTSDTVLPVYAYNAPGQSGLLRTGLLGSYQGLYSCIISSEGNESSSLVAAVVRDTEYNSAVAPSITTDLYFSLLSSIDSPQVAFSLSFNVTNRPPTSVTCSLNDTVIPVNGTDIHRRPIGSTLNNILIEVVVTVRIREAGLYRCTVSNSRVDNTNVFPAISNGRFISVTDPPSDVLVNRTGLTSFNVSWTPPPSLSAPLTGYHIFYHTSSTSTGANIISSGVKIVNNGSQTVSIDDLIFNTTYQIFAVSVGGDVPSQHSNKVIGTTGVTFNITTHPSSIPYIGDTGITLTCTVTLDVPVIVFQLVWLGPNNTAIHTNSVNMNQSSIDLRLDLIDIATIGMYRCVANFSNDNITAMTDYELMGQVPDINVTVYSDQSLIEGTYTDLLCTATDVHGLTPFTNITWYYNGTEISNGTDYTMSQERREVLRINQLSLSRDNGGTYTCTVGVYSIDYLIGAMGNDSLTLTVQRLTANNINISISFSKSDLVLGDSFILQCVLTLPDRYVHQPKDFKAVAYISFDLPVTFLPNVNEEAIVRNGSTYIQNYNFTSITDDHIYPYLCEVELVNGLTKETDREQLRAQITPPSLSFNDAIIQVYESTPLIITCNIILPSLTMNIHEDGSWTGPDGKRVQRLFSGRITVSGTNGHNDNVLRISPADNGDHSLFNDTGLYTYSSTISTRDSSNLLPATNNATVFIRVIDLPPLQVTINDTGRSIFGQNVTLNCSVEPITNLEVSITWKKNESILSNTTGSDCLILPLRSIDNSFNGVYTCTVQYNVSATGDYSSVDREYELIVQDLGSPLNFQSLSVTPFTIVLSWDQPSLAIFGPFERYELTITYNNGTNGSTVKIDPQDTMYPLDGLSPHQLVVFKISVLYSDGYGPIVPLNITTLQYESSPVTNLSIDYQYSFIRWSPPLVPNGVIDHYRLVLTEYKDTLIDNVTVENTSYNITSLAPGVPYELTVWPVNGAGPGINEYLLFFVQEIAPLPVSNVTQVRINGTHAMVDWSPLSLSEARGFIQNYSVLYRPVDTGGRSKRQTLEVIVGPGVRSVLLMDLIPSSSYEISVQATSNGGVNSSVPAISNRPPTSNFQLQIRPIDSCNDNKDTLIDAIESALVGTIVSNCSCSFQEQYISGETLTCSNSSAYYRANITSYGSINSSLLIEIISHWIAMGPNITYDTSSFIIDPSCPVLYNSNDDPFCLVDHSPSPTITDQPSTEGVNGGIIIVIAVIVVVVAVLVILIIATGAILYCLYKRNKLKTRNQLERHPASFSYYKRDFKHSDMIPEEEEDEIYEPLDPDGNLRVSRNKSLTTTLPLPPVPENGERAVTRSERSQSMIIPGQTVQETRLSATPTRLLPLPPTPPTVTEVHNNNNNNVSTVSNGTQPIQTSESVPTRHSGPKTGSFSPGLGSVNEETDSINKVTAGGSTPKGFITIPSAGSFQSTASRRASNLTIASHSMSDRGPLSPATSGSPVVTPSSVLSPQYESLMSPLYANADTKEVAKRTKSLEEEDEEKYIIMKSTGYADPIELIKNDTSPQEYETPVSSRGGTPVPTSRPGSKVVAKSLSPRDRVSSCNSMSSREEGAPFNIDESDIYSRPAIPNIYNDDDDDITGHEYAVPVASPKPLSPVPTGSDWLYAEPNSPTSTGSVPQDYEVPIFTKQIPVSPLTPSAPQEYQVPVVSSSEDSPRTSIDPSSPSFVDQSKPVNEEQSYFVSQEYDIPVVPSRDDPKNDSTTMEGDSSINNEELVEELPVKEEEESNERETEEVQLYIEEENDNEHEEMQNEVNEEKENGGLGLVEESQGKKNDNVDQEKDTAVVSDENGTNL